MKPPRRDTKPYFSRPLRQLTLMLVVLVLVALGSYIAFPRVSAVFFANVWLNGFIFAVFVIGVVTCFLQIYQLSASIRWIEGFATETPGHRMTVPPRLLAPMAALLRERGARGKIAAGSARTMLESVGTRIDEDRDITRYIVNLLIFLGLLGTFYGLAITVPAVVETIRSLAPSEDEGSVAIFDRLMQGLEDQLGGMGTAFSSSLLGLAGSLVVGLLELFASQSQNRFYRELEDWLSSFTRIGLAGDGEGSGDGAGLEGLLDHMAGQVEAMQATHARSEENIGALTEAVERLAARLERESDAGAALARVAEGQERLVAALETRGDGEGFEDGDAEARMRLRSIDVQLLRILEEISAGRQESITDLRSDLANLTRSVRQLSRATSGAGPDRET